MKGRTWRDTVAIKCLLLRQLLPFRLCFLSDLLRLLRSTEPATSLLIHLGAWCHPIHGHEEEFLWFNLAKKMVDI